MPPGAILPPGPTFTDSGGFQVLSLGAGFKKVLAMDVTGLQSDHVIADGKTRLAKVDDEALNIVYVDFEMPGPNRFPWTAHPDSDGNFWIPQYGVSNRIARFNPASGEIKEFRVPHPGPALIHSAVPAPDGSVWLTEAGAKKLGRWDPATQKISEFQDDWCKHTIKVHPDGSVWSTGGLTRFDPKTATYTHIPEVPTAYGIALDKEGTVWFTEMTRAGSLGKVDPKTLKVTKYIPPTRDRPRRIQIDEENRLSRQTERGSQVHGFFAIGSLENGMLVAQ